MPNYLGYICIPLDTFSHGPTASCVFVVQQTHRASNDKKHGGRVGVVKLEDGRPNLNISDLDSAWNNTYYRSVRQMMLAGEKPKLFLSVTKKRRLDIEVNVGKQSIG